MSLDLYEREAAESLSRMQPVMVPETGAFDGFFRGVGLSAMQTFAKAGRAIDLAGAIGPILQDKITGGTEAQDRYFKEHDETFGRAVDYWTPNPREVGQAGQIVGQLAATLPMVIASPAFTVAQTQLAVAEDLASKGVDTTKAQAVGAAQAAGLGLGIWMPILGQNLWQRVLLGGAGFNVAQGAAMRGVSELILADTVAAEDFKAFDPAALTLDVLLGMAFGGIAHLSPAQRAQGKVVWERIQRWAGTLKAEDVDAIAALRQAQHLNVDSIPGRPADVQDVDAHVTRLRTAIDQLATDKPVEVSDLPAPKVEADGRMVDNAARANELMAEVEAVRDAEDLPPIPETEGPPVTRGAGTPPGELGEPARPTAPTEADIDAAAVFLRDEIGAAERGGRVIIDEATRDVTPGAGDVLGRTVWVGHKWWFQRPDPSLDAAHAKRAIDKWQAGKKLGAREQRFIDYIRGEVRNRMEAESAVPPEDTVANVIDDLQRQGIDATPQNVIDYELVAKASEIDEARVESAAVKYENDDSAFMAEIRKIVDESSQETAGRGEARERAPEGRPAETAREETGLEPLAAEAERFAAENSDVEIVVGTDADGDPVVTTVRKFLDDAVEASRFAEEDARLFEVAAACMLGVA